MNPTPSVPPTNPFGTAPATAPIARGSFIESDIACRRCGYNLRGLREDMACPECGTAVGLSTRGDFLRYADPGWVETIARGARLILWGILASLIAVCAGGGIGIGGGAGNPLVILLPIAAGMITVFGVWLLTTADPGRVGEDRFARARRITRFALLCGLGANAVQLLGSLPTVPANAGFLLGILAAGLVLISVFGEYFKFLYIEHLTARIPDDFMTRRARFLRFGIVITLGTATVFGTLSAILQTTGGPGGGAGGRAAGARFSGLSGVIFVITLIAFVLYSVLGLASILFLFRLSKRLREQAQNARLSWAAHAEMARSR